MKYGNAYKWLSVMLVLLIVSAAIGCGKKEAEEATPTPTAIPMPTATPAEPTGQTGSLSSVTGDVQVLRQSAVAWIAAASGMKIWTGDSLKTGSDGYALITFFDGSVMEVEAESEISVEELSAASGGSTTVRISQVLGNTINRVENLVDSSSTYEVETLAGSAVVRGTIYRIQVNQYGEITHTCCSTSDEEDNKQHNVDFSGGGSTVKVPEGMTSCCWEGGAPGSPFYTNPADDLLQFSGDSGGGGSEPTCAPGCYYSMIGDGTCQLACDVEACSYDCSGFTDGDAIYGDAINDGNAQCDCPYCSEGFYPYSGPTGVNCIPCDGCNERVYQGWCYDAGCSNGYCWSEQQQRCVAY